MGFEIQEAENGQAAIDLWQQWQPHLIFMDMQMPILNGYEATQRIRALEQSRAEDLPFTRIIALTASAFAEQRQESLTAGCNDFVGKPFRREELLKVLSQHLGGQYLDEAVATEANSQISTPRKPNYILDSVALTIMPAEWIAQLRFAAAQGNDAKSLKLIAQIPPEHSSLIEALTDLVEKYQFDQLTALMQSTDLGNL